MDLNLTTNEEEEEKKEEKALEKIAFLNSIENLDRATSTIFENAVSIFLPFKRLDKTDVYKFFMKNNQILEVQYDLFERVEIRGRLLGQSHKDILESLLSSHKTYSVSERRFKIKTTAYQLTKRLNRNIGNKRWLIQRLKEISECRINIYFRDKKGNDIDLSFGFLDDLIIVNKNEIVINFTSAYTYFLAQTELIDYRQYIDDILLIDKKCDEWTKIRKLSRAINADFIKAIVRYMLQHRGNNSQIRIDNLIDKLNYCNLMSQEQTKHALADLRRSEVQAYLKDKFGISLTNDEETITFNVQEEKPRYLIK